MLTPVGCTMVHLLVMGGCSLYGPKVGRGTNKDHLSVDQEPCAAMPCWCWGLLSAIAGVTVRFGLGEREVLFEDMFEMP